MSCKEWNDDIFVDKIRLSKGYGHPNTTWFFETVEAHIEIYYCPFCGSKLNNDGCTKER